LRCDTVTTLAHLPDIRFLQEPIGGGSTSQVLRAASAPVEGEEEQTERRAPEGPLGRGSAKPVVPSSSSMAPHRHARSSRTFLVGKSAMPLPETKTSSLGVRTRGQMASTVKGALEASSAKAPRSLGPANGSTEEPSQKPSSSLVKPLISMSG
jgi:hypothetical protein